MFHLGPQSLSGDFIEMAGLLCGPCHMGRFSA
jgi:hypothetical protein